MHYNQGSNKMWDQFFSDGAASVLEQETGKQKLDALFVKGTLVMNIESNCAMNVKTKIEQ